MDIDINEISVGLKFVVALRIPIKPAPNANESSNDKSTRPKAILMLCLLPKVINSV